MGGFDIPGGIATNQIWEFTPTTNAWVQKAAVLPVPRGYLPTTTIGTLIYMGGGASITAGAITDAADSFVYNPVADSIGTITNIPRPTGETRALNVNNKMWVMGGGRTTPNPSNEVDIYDPVAGTWSIGTPFMTARRNFPTDTNGTDRVWLAGGYAPTTPTASMEIFGICGTPTPTPTATATATGSSTPTATPTASPSSTPTPTVIPSATPTATATGTPSATPTCTPSSFHVLIVYSDDGPPTQLQSEILAEPNVTAVDLFDGQAGTPTLAQLQAYQIVVPYSNFPFFDADTLGNNLADYVDGGGVVVRYGFSYLGPGEPYGINGRWLSGNYNPYNYSENLVFNAFSLGTHNAAHPLMAGVTALNSDFENIVTLAAGATEVAQDNFGVSLVAYRPVSGGHTTVGVTAYVGFDATQSGDWGKVIVNAGRWLISGPCGTPSPTPQRRERRQRRLRARREVPPGRGHRRRL